MRLIRICCVLLALGSLWVTQAGQARSDTSCSWRRVTNAYTVTNADNCAKLILGGAAFYTLSFGPISEYDQNFCVGVRNEDGNRAKTISINGAPPFKLWPSQHRDICKEESTWVVTPQFERWRWSASQTFYIDPVNGDDANDGLAPGTGNALKTAARAGAIITFDIDRGRGMQAIIQLTDGAYTSSTGCVSYGPRAAGLLVRGNPAAPENVIIMLGDDETCFQARDFSVVSVTDLTLQSSGTGSIGMEASQFGVIDFAGINFGTMSGGVHVKADDHGAVNVTGAYTITGSASQHMQAAGLARIDIGPTVTIPTALSFDYFVTAAHNSVITSGGLSVSFSGSGVSGTTGQRSLITTGSQLDTAGTIFPGNR